MNMNEFTYFGLGAVVGVATAVLFSPRAGSETREYLRSQAENGTDYVTSHASDVRDATSQLIKRGKKVVQHQTENFHRGRGCRRSNLPGSGAGHSVGNG